MKIILETSRLFITLPDIRKFDLVYTLDSDPDVMKYIGNGKTRTKEDSLFWYNKSIVHAEKYGFSFGLAYEKSTGEFIGRAGISYCGYNDTQPDIEIGYRLLKKYWAQGYATELANALVKLGFTRFKLEKICGFAQPDNTASLHVLEKIGMQFIGEDHYAEEKVVRYEIYNPHNLNHNI